MRLAASKPPFAWDELEPPTSLAAIRETLAAIPDGPLLEALRRRRHNGCDKYPVHLLWGVLLLSILPRHTTLEAGLAELRRKAGLRPLVGIERAPDVPHGWNLSRFLEVLGQEPYLSRPRTLFDDLVKRLGVAVPDLGRHTAGDATGLAARRDDNAERVAEETAQGRPPVGCGRKEYTDDAGTVTKVVEWSGYKRHLLVDVKHEVALAYPLTDTKAGDNEELESLVRQAKSNLPEDRLETSAYDKAADDIKVPELLRDEGSKPVIQDRSCGPEGDTERVLGGRIPLHVVHDEKGTSYCCDTSSEPPVLRPMSYAGHEKDRGTLEYRCPAEVEGFACGSEENCHADKPYGMTVRVPQEIDRRRFPPIRRGAKQFERLYKGRTSWAPGGSTPTSGR